MQRPHLREAASVGIHLHLAKLLQKTNKKTKKMSKMTIVQLGVIVFAICLSTQVVSQNITDLTAGGNSTSNPNTTTTTVATDTHSSSANTTSPAGAGVSLHAGTVSFVIPVIMAASLLQRYC